jgi:hypothetical protein
VCLLGGRDIPGSVGSCLSSSVSLLLTSVAARMRTLTIPSVSQAYLRYARA